MTALIASVLLIAAGCGDDDTSSGSTTEAPGPSSTAEPPASTAGTTTSPATTPAATDPATTTSTTASTTTTSDGTTTTTTPPAPLPVGLARWPAVPTDTTDVGDVPRLLPSEPIDGADDVVRNEYASDPSDRPSYQQIWVSDADDAIFQIATYPTVDPYPTPDADPVEVAPWTTATSGPAGEGYAFLTLTDGDGFVRVSGEHLTEDQLVVAANSMTRRAGDVAGWDVELPTPAMRLIGEGWSTRIVGRDVDWFGDDELIAEISIVHGNPERLTYGPRPFPDTDITIADIHGTPAVVAPQSYGDETVTIVLSSPEPDLVVYFGLRAPIDEAVAIARSIQPVDQATWESASRLSNDQSDGCLSFLC